MRLWCHPGEKAHSAPPCVSPDCPDSSLLNWSFSLQHLHPNLDRESLAHGLSKRIVCIPQILFWFEGVSCTASADLSHCTQKDGRFCQGDNGLHVSSPTESTPLFSPLPCRKTKQLTVTGRGARQTAPPVFDQGTVLKPRQMDRHTTAVGWSSSRGLFLGRDFVITVCI